MTYAQESERRVRTLVPELQKLEPCKESTGDNAPEIHLEHILLALERGFPGYVAIGCAGHFLRRSLCGSRGRAQSSSTVPRLQDPRRRIIDDRQAIVVEPEQRGRFVARAESRGLATTDFSPAAIHDARDSGDMRNGRYLRH